jgi:hypothetical protein
MWFSLDRGPHPTDGVEQLLPQLQGIVEFVATLQQQLANDGVGGIRDALRLYGELRAVLEAVSGAELQRAQAEVARLQSTLQELTRGLEELERLKRSVPPPPVVVADVPRPAAVQRRA